MSQKHSFLAKLFAAALALFPAGRACPQNASGAESVLPLRRLALFSSGMGFFEHSGTLAAPSRIPLSFAASAANDALKSLMVNDPRSDFPAFSYVSASALYETLRSLRIDLSGNPGTGEILNGMRGAEIEVLALQESIAGRILGVEYRPSPGGNGAEGRLTLFSGGGIISIALNDIVSFSFKDPAVNADLARALDLLLESGNAGSRELLLALPGEGSRNVSLSYVIPVPVWKVSYRLDLGASGTSSGNSSATASGAGNAFFQGWALVDNDSDTDWVDVELSLVSGRPVSFIQNLFAPYHTSRPVVPLGIAGVAESRTYESGRAAEDAMAQLMAMPEAESVRSRAADAAYGTAAAPAFAPAAPAAAGGYQNADARQAGDQFEFTIKNRITIERRKSAMLPLAETFLRAEKTLVFSGSRALPGVSMNPALAAELTNTSGLKLPAGPVTVYDGGTYAGDALIEFFPENEKRLISYGEDLSVRGSVNFANSRAVTAVTISQGVMTITRRLLYERVYTIVNTSGEQKRIVIEHPITPEARLSEPVSFDESTPSLYRFNRTLGANQELRFAVREEAPLSERVVLAQLRPETFLSYTANQEIPADVRSALARAGELRQRADEAAAVRQSLENRRASLIADQDRIRRNLEAAGNQTPQGQDYLRRMVEMDGEIEAFNVGIAEAEANAEAARKNYDEYVGSLAL